MDKVKEVVARLFNEETWHSMTDNILAFSGVVFGIIVVILLVLLGWFIVWKMFLVRFPLIRELVYGSGDEIKNNKTSRGGGDNEPLRRSARLKSKSSHED